MSDAESALPRILELARAQRPDPAGWSLAVNADWIESSFLADGVSTRYDTMPTGDLGGCASVRALGPEEPGVVVVTSMVRPGCEHLWDAQLAWIEARVAHVGATTVRVVSECLSEAEALRWAVAGYDLVFEELAMERDVTEASGSAQWPHGISILEWNAEAAAASFEVYDAAFRERPRFPGWSREEWVDWLTGEADFLPQASFCAVVDGVPAGFVVCSRGWIDQVGVVPSHRRRGIASALVTEATTRMRTLGISVARLHVNTNNPAALATWRGLGWQECGRRGRFERLRIPG